MKKYIFNTILYIILLGGVVILYLVMIFIKPELVDSFYYRFTTDKASSLILGGSRAAQGIKPEVINKMVDLEDNKIINHSFALGPSSFGPNYYKEVTKKLSKKSTNGLFIISVGPWTLSIDPENVKDDSTQFFEVREKLFVGNLKSSSSNPNFDYLYNHWNNKFSPFDYIFKSIINYEGLITLHEDGWLEISINMDTAANNTRIRKSEIEYRAKEVKLSHTRLYFLDKIIGYLADYGDVVLVRMPVTSQMAEIESSKFPEFDNLIQQIADKQNIYYFNFIKESGKFLTTDIHHLYKDDSERFTLMLCDSINNSLYSPQQGITAEINH